ncbi:hypothetical protein HNP84_002478 [Thermocatellispora tengchongensis]|uniref:Uncharacterized protein n=1 Tax=Thermocatellispora tengchongensis TaxID=1073253 RepID=A0A840P6A7_9ACTN|nr:hypothetical protein [Thermocatellispora tengchongensis]MBB5132757.1 hypothetical protein [Thermocatellispora tengchongensis]
MHAPLYLAPPSTDRIREHIHAGRLGAIVTPSSGNRVPEDGWWAADSGIFGKKYVGDEAYMDWLEDRREHADRCLFATAPDVPFNAFATINRSYPYLQRIRQMGYPVALVAQDHLEFCNWWRWEDFDCLFIGGSTSWKLSPAAAVLARAAGAAGLWVHVGRVNSFKRHRYAALAMDADSADGTLLTNGPDKHLPSALRWTWHLLRDDAPSLVDPDDLTDHPYDARYDLGCVRPAEVPPTPTPEPEVEQFALF